MGMAGREGRERGINRATHTTGTGHHGDWMFARSRGSVVSMQQISTLGAILFSLRIEIQLTSGIQEILRKTLPSNSSRHGASAAVPVWLWWPNSRGCPVACCDPEFLHQAQLLPLRTAWLSTREPSGSKTERGSARRVCAGCRHRCRAGRCGSGSSQPQDSPKDSAAHRAWQQVSHWWGCR